MYIYLYIFLYYIIPKLSAAPLQSAYVLTNAAVAPLSCLYVCDRTNSGQQKIFTALGYAKDPSCALFKLHKYKHLNRQKLFAKVCPETRTQPYTFRYTYTVIGMYVSILTFNLFYGCALVFISYTRLICISNLPVAHFNVCEGDFLPYLFFFLFI